MYSRSVAYSLFVVITLVVAMPFPAQADKCTTAKLKALAKKESGLLGCSAKVAKIGDPSVGPACVAKVVTK